MENDFLRAIGRTLLVLTVFFVLSGPWASVARAQEATTRDVVPPIRLDDEPIPYPEGARGDTVVTLELEIEKDGTVGGVVVRDGAPPFDDAARIAARAWRFSPAMRNGLPIRARILGKVAFHEPPPVAVPAPTTTSEENPAPPESPEANPYALRPIAAEALPAEPITVSVVGEAREEPGSTHIPRNEMRLVPGAFADPFRVVEVLPGIAPILSGIPYFSVRGAPPGDVG
jgi:TonB family protein